MQSNTTTKIPTIAIIGAGPAGLSAALWLKQLNFKPVIIEKNASAGGMLNVNFLENEWVLGQIHQTGSDIAKHFSKHANEKNIDILFSNTLEAIELHPENFLLTLENNFSLNCSAIILCTGTRYIGEEIFNQCPSFAKINKNNIFCGPYAFKNIDSLENQHIAIIGAGDNAFENASILLNKGCRVSLLARSTPKTQKKFLNNVLSHKNFSLLSNTSIKDIQNYENDSLRLFLNNGNDTVDIQRLHVLTGYKPNSEALTQLIQQNLQQTLQQDSEGFLLCDNQGRTNINNIYAAGDIINKDFPCVVSAISSGALAAKTISRDLDQPSD